VHETPQFAADPQRTDFWLSPLIITHVGYALDRDGLCSKIERNDAIALRALESDPTDVVAWSLKAAREFRHGCYAECVDTNRHLETFPRSAWPRGDLPVSAGGLRYLQWIIAAIAIDDDDAVYEAYRAGKEAKKLDRLAYARVAEWHADSGRFAEAIRLFQVALRIPVRYAVWGEDLTPDIYFRLAWCYEKVGKPYDAQQVRDDARMFALFGEAGPVLG
jgi:tetratricopeptide (TPR) repeat protein